MVFSNPDAISSMNTMSNEKRKYRLKARAESQEHTRQRIVAATGQLHEEVGPARTTVAEIARRAGVQRLTVYNHFPDEAELFAACSAHWLAAHPYPDPTPAFAIEDPGDRLGAVLVGLYGWFASNAPMVANLQRDRDILPALDALLKDGADEQFAALAEALAAGFQTKRSPTNAARAAVRLALDFWTWRRLREEHLDDAAAADLMVEAVRAAARG
jgi:AcrR family transcriptional regulator